MPMRTAKSCGPDAPTLVSSLRVMIRKRRWQESPVTGESTKETVKTIAQGMLECFGEPVVTNSCVYFYFTREAMGATGTRHSLRPLFFEGRFRNSSGAICAAGTRSRGASRDRLRGASHD